MIKKSYNYCPYFKILYFTGAILNQYDHLPFETQISHTHSGVIAEPAVHASRAVSDRHCVSKLTEFNDELKSFAVRSSLRQNEWLMHIIVCVLPINPPIFVTFIYQRYSCESENRYELNPHTNYNQRREQT